MLTYSVSKHKDQDKFDVDLHMNNQYQRTVAKGFTSEVSAQALADELNLAFLSGQEYIQLLEED